MLAAANRLTKEEDFQKVKSKGSLTQSLNFGMLVLARKDSLDSRFGFVVSTKVSQHATTRNRIKRVLSESVRHNIAFIKKGYDVVLLAKPTMERAYTADIMKEVKSALEKAKLI